ncbi:DUF7009 family protein [Maribacter sp. 2304DJ31-5]|uniref:DUF7009 family protein n=1 Tax=Maribacter sp. 2304DJ31-5 TaxID=3386273 RepID=UPI0039BD14B3
MKIRIKGNSIRYRLTKTEVETLSKKGRYSEKTKIGDQTFHYTVCADANKTHLDAAFADNTITLSVPKKDTLEWPGNEQVGFQHTVVLPNGGKLSLLLEKDFVCMDATLEDQSDNYPNPKLDQNIS